MFGNIEHARERVALYTDDDNGHEQEGWSFKRPDSQFELQIKKKKNFQRQSIYRRHAVRFSRPFCIYV